MEQELRLQSILDAIIDRNLYGLIFFYGGLPYWTIGLIVQYYAFYQSIFPILIIYMILHLALIPFSSLFAKNFKREFHPMSRFLSTILFFTSLLSLGFSFRIFEGTIQGILNFLLITSIAEIALISSLITIIVISQRESLLKNVGLIDNLFEAQKGRWKNELDRFPNIDRIIEGFDGGNYIRQLFIAGYFNLATLWTCSVMEEIIDAIGDGIISVNPNQTIIQTEDRRRRYPRQLRNLNFNIDDLRIELTLERLWHEMRNNIAHHKYFPTYKETNETIKILKAFFDRMPVNIRNLKY